MPERAALEWTVVDRHDAGAAPGRAVAPAARRRAQVDDCLPRPRLSTQHSVGLFNLQVGARGCHRVVRHPALSSEHGGARHEGAIKPSEDHEHSARQSDAAGRGGHRQLGDARKLAPHQVGSHSLLDLYGTGQLKLDEMRLTESDLREIDKVVVIDQGGGGDGSGGLARLAKTGPTVVFNLLQQLEALGLAT